MKVVRDDLQYETENAETSLFRRCYSQACAVAALIDIQPTMPRVASWQIFRANAESNTPFQYYLRNDCYPFLDHLTQGIYKVICERLLHRKSDWNYYLHIKFTRLYPHKSSLLLLMCVLRMSNHCEIIIRIIIYRTDNRFDKYGSTVYLMYGFIPSIDVERDITVKDITE